MANLTAVFQKHRKLALASGLALVLVFVLRMRSGGGADVATDPTGLTATDGTLGGGGGGGDTGTSTGTGLTADDLAAAQSDQLAAIQQTFGDFAAAEASMFQDLGMGISDLEGTIGANAAYQQDQIDAQAQRDQQALDNQGALLAAITALSTPANDPGASGQAKPAAPGNKKAAKTAVKVKPKPKPPARAKSQAPPRPKRIQPRPVSRPAAKPTPKPTTKFFTFKKSVPLKSTQTLKFTPGRGYYAAPKPKPKPKPKTVAGWSRL